MVGSFRAPNFQKSRKFHELPRKLFHFKPLTPTLPGRGRFRGHPGREERGEEWRQDYLSKGAGREEAEREGGRREKGGRGCRRE